MKIAGLILAGGKSQRMGRPKALLTLRGATFLDTLISTMSGCDPLVVVLGHEPERIRAGLAAAGGASFVINADYEQGQLTSLQCGLRALPDTVEAVAFTPVDYPAFSRDTVQRLCLSLSPGHLLVIPTIDGRRGHPVLAHRALFPEFLGLGTGKSARDVIHAHRDRTCYVDVEDSGIVNDVDTPEAYQELLRSNA